jgi:hypothetical protein
VEQNRKRRRDRHAEDTRRRRAARPHRKCACKTDITGLHPNATRCGPCQAVHRSTGRRPPSRRVLSCLDCGTDISDRAASARYCESCAAARQHPRPERTCPDCDVVLTGQRVRRCPEHTRERRLLLWRQRYSGNMEEHRRYAREWARDNRDLIALRERQFKKDHPEQVRRAKRNYFARHPEWAIYKRARKRARQTGLEFTITARDIRAVLPQDGRCPVLGLELTRNTGGRGPRRAACPSTASGPRAATCPATSRSSATGPTR